MKKTVLLFFATLILTGLLFFSGKYLLDIAAESDTLAEALLAPNNGTDGGDAAEGGAALGSSDEKRDFSPGLKFFQSFNASTSDIVDILRSLRQDTGGPVTVLVLAGDMGVNTDAMMVARYNPKNKRFSVISIPRDTYVTLSGYKYHKINGVYSIKNGAERLKSLLEEMLGHKIDYYVHLDMKVVREVVDLLDGVEYDVPCDMIYDDPDQDLHINIKKGTRTLTGKQVEGLLRFRHPNKWTNEIRKYYDGSDLMRI